MLYFVFGPIRVEFVLSLHLSLALSQSPWNSCICFCKTAHKMLISFLFFLLRLCGGNLEMLQAHVLELGNICQETSTKGPCEKHFLQTWNHHSQKIKKRREKNVDSYKMGLTASHGVIVHCTYLPSKPFSATSLIKLIRAILLTLVFTAVSR